MGFKCPIMVPNDPEDNVYNTVHNAFVLMSSGIKVFCKFVGWQRKEPCGKGGREITRVTRMKEVLS